MYGIFTYIYHKNQPNVGKYTSPMDPMGYPNTEAENEMFSHQSLAREKSAFFLDVLVFFSFFGVPFGCIEIYFGVVGCCRNRDIQMHSQVL